MDKNNQYIYERLDMNIFDTVLIRIITCKYIRHVKLSTHSSHLLQHKEDTKKK